MFVYLFCLSFILFCLSAKKRGNMTKLLSWSRNPNIFVVLFLPLFGTWNMPHTNGYFLCNSRNSMTAGMSPAKCRLQVNLSEFSVVDWFSWSHRQTASKTIFDFFSYQIRGKLSSFASTDYVYDADGRKEKKERKSLFVGIKSFGNMMMQRIFLATNHNFYILARTGASRFNSIQSSKNGNNCKLILVLRISIILLHPIHSEIRIHWRRIADIWKPSKLSNSSGNLEERQSEKEMTCEFN